MVRGCICSYTFVLYVSVRGTEYVRGHFGASQSLFGFYLVGVVVISNKGLVLLPACGWPCNAADMVH